jgi:hypothetical protein
VVNPILCVGSHPNDVAPLLTIARRLQDETGVDAVFSTVAPDDVATVVHEQVVAGGFSVLDRPLAVAPLRNERNPVVRARRWRDDNRAVVAHVVDEIRPSAVLATVNPLPCTLLDGVARGGVPALMLQLWFWGDKQFRKAWRADDRLHATSSAPWKRIVRHHAERGAEMAFGVCDRYDWDLHHATLAVEGPAMRRQLLDDGVPADRVVVTGNPVLDDLHALAQAPGAARAHVRAQLAMPGDRPVVTYFRSHEDRFPQVPAQARLDAQTTVLRSLREGAPGATVVVKLHPKERPGGEREVLHGIDPDVVVAGSDVDANELIAASDVVVGTFSTTLLQAVALDRPAVAALFWPGMDYWSRATDWSGVDRATDGDRLTGIVQRALTDPGYQQRWSGRRADFTRDRFRFDGQGTERVTTLLERMVGRTGAHPS